MAKKADAFLALFAALAADRRAPGYAFGAAPAGEANAEEEEAASEAEEAEAEAAAAAEAE
jgi:hypothetical protein